MMKNCFIRMTWATPIVLASVLAAQGEALQVPMAVAEPIGLARKAEPISGGIPLPKGMFQKGQAFAIFGADGRERPSQALPLVVDRDGSLRWVLVDFQDDLAASATNRYVLKAVARTARPARPLKVTDRAGAVTVDTGAIRLTISRTQPFSLFSSVERAG
ncbi:hypothetical protein LCGC14_2370430, partial [marine sediment metagenome]